MNISYIPAVFSPFIKKLSHYILKHVISYIKLVVLYNKNSFWDCLHNEIKYCVLYSPFVLCLKQSKSVRTLVNSKYINHRLFAICRAY